MTLTRRHEAGPGVRSRILEQVTAELAADSEVGFAYLYGSLAGSEPFRDVDVGVYLRPAAPSPATDYALTLAQRLSTRVGLPVDVRVLNGAPVSFVYHVLRGQLILSHDDGLLGEVMERTIRQYLDLAPLLRRSAKEAFAA